MLLTLDAGNTSLKLAVWKQDEIVYRAQSAYDEVGFDLPEDVADELTDVVIASVIDDSGEDLLRSRCQRSGLQEPRFMRTQASCCGVVNAYADPSAHGVDRWAALIGARSICPGEALCIIDCGTATTVDLLNPDGEHLGGRIMPGMELMRRSLIENTYGIGSSSEIAEGFPAETAAAVATGSFSCSIAGIASLIEEATAILGDDMRTLLTGGAASLYSESLSDRFSLQIEPDLVMTGLRIWSESV